MTKSITLLMGATALLSLSVAGASAATNKVGAGAGHFAQRFVSPSKSSTLYDQNDNDGGNAIVSQNFDSSVSQYDSAGADDFTVPKGASWTISEVDVTGLYYNGYGPATSVNVLFYKSKKGLPKGNPVAEFDNLKFKDNGTGSFAIKLKKADALKAGTYLVSVVANLGGVGDGGQWGWEIRSVQNGSPAAWENQGGGFGICPTWNTLESCLGYGPDYMFALKGKAS